MLGVALSLAAAMGFAGSAVFARIGLQHVRPTTGTIVSLLIGISITLTLSIIFHQREIIALSGIAFLWFFISGVINFPLGRLLNYTGVSKIGVSKSTAIVGSSPLFAAILAVTVGGETINTLMMIGTVAIIGGVALIVGQR
ncbi:MAG: DMT family transporter [Chloroflexi bacterium]|nr:DMT family transporter [Chloroflexota bacterium]